MPSTADVRDVIGVNTSPCQSHSCADSFVVDGAEMRHLHISEENHRHSQQTEGKTCIGVGGGEGARRRRGEIEGKIGAE